MNSNPYDPLQGADDPRLTAYAMGEITDAAERIFIEEELEKRPYLLDEVNSIREVMGTLTNAFKKEELPEIDEEEKMILLQEEPKKNLSFFPWLLSSGAIAAGIALILTLRLTNTPVEQNYQTTQEADAVAIVPIESDSPRMPGLADPSMYIGANVNGGNENALTPDFSNAEKPAFSSEYSRFIPLTAADSSGNSGTVLVQPTPKATVEHANFDKLYNKHVELITQINELQEELMSMGAQENFPVRHPIDKQQFNGITIADAIATLEQAITRLQRNQTQLADARDLLDYINLAQQQYESGDVEAAKQTIAKAQTKFPNNQKLLELSNLIIIDNRVEEQIALYEIVPSEGQTHAVGQSDGGNMLVTGGNINGTNYSVTTDKEYRDESGVKVTFDENIKFDIEAPPPPPLPKAAIKPKLPGSPATPASSLALSRVNFEINPQGSVDAMIMPRADSNTGAMDNNNTRTIRYYMDPNGLNPDTEPYNREAYDSIAENSFQAPTVAPLSTFSIDVDTASYSNMRRMITNGHTPPAGSIRIEELINYFPYEYEAPAKDAAAPFAVHTEVASTPWAPEHRLLKIGLKGYEVPWEERPASNFVFLLDVSGSMSHANKLPLVKESMRLLVERLGANDRVAIVVYAGIEGLALPSTTANNTETIMHAIDNLRSGGSTNGGAGIELAYKTAEKHFIEGGLNRVILCTDGDFNVGISDRSSLVDLIERKAKSGVFLSILGFGQGNYQDATMEELSNKGNGNYAYIDSQREANKLLVDQAAGTLQTIAKDVKIQVEFNPSKVAAYRLIGYENRALEAKDFNDDTKDAGEIGVGHTVTALYEIVPHGVEINMPGVDELKYQKTETAPTTKDASGEIATVKLRYKKPDSDTSTKLEVPIIDGGKSIDSASEDLRFAASVAAFGQVLRNSEFKGNFTMEQTRKLAEGAKGNDRGGYRSEFVELIRQSNAQGLLKEIPENEESTPDFRSK